MHVPRSCSLPAKPARQRELRPTAAAAALAALLAPAAWAGEAIDLGHDTTLDYSVTASYGAAVRTGNQSNTLLSPANINGDDGNRNFKRGDMIANRVSLLGEAHVKHDNFGALVRGSVFYDWAYSGTSSNNAPGTVSHSGPFNEFTGSAQDYHESRAQLLDAYVYGAVPIESTQLSFKLGNQVVAWGESLFFANIAGAPGARGCHQGIRAGRRSRRTSCCPSRRPRCSGRSRPHSA
ncbi:DUF1302 domain-containing protein [Cupriavidus basilensis]